MAQEDENQVPDNFLDLPDEEFEKFGMYPPGTSDSSTSEEEEEADTPLEAEQEEETPEPEEEESQEDDFNDEGEEEESDPESEESETDEDDDAAESQAPAEGASAEDGGEEESEEGEESEGEEEDPKEAFYKALTSPIKANGREIKINTPEEAVKLIQMGAGYTKRIAELKPARQLFKTLEQHNMLDEQSLGFAVDLVNGNKDAILKLMRDKGINPLELDTESEVEYKSNLRLAPEQSIEFDDVMDSIKDSEHYDATVNTVKGWDRASQSEVAKDPRLISLLNTQMENGVYQAVNTEVQRLQALGDPRLTKLSDLEAYVAVGRLMANDGNLPVPSAEQKSTSKVGQKVRPKAGSKSNPKTQSKKKAAGVPRKKPAQQQSSVDINPLSMPDDEFDKMMAKFA